MLDANIQEQLRNYLQRLQQPIELTTTLDSSALSENIQELVNQIAGLSDLVTVAQRFDSESNSNTQWQPSFTVAPLTYKTQCGVVRFAGLPMGHEFTSLVLALLQMGGYPPKVDASVIEQIRNLPGHYCFETFVSLSCHNCPDVVQALNLMAVINPRIQHTMVDGAYFQSVVEQRQVMAVPTIYLNGQEFGAGRMSIEEILAKLDTGAAAREAEKINAQAPYDVLIVGGGPAGSAAAVYAARKGIRTGIVAERFGGQVMDTLGIENFISVQETEGPKLVAQLEQHVKSYDVDIMNLQRAQSLTLPTEASGYVQVQTVSGATLKAKTVIISTGARWRELNVPGENEYRGKGVAYCPHCDGPLFKGKRVAVIGGGNSGVEAAIDLAGIVGYVSLIEFGAELRADAVLQRKLKSLSNVSIITNAQTTEVLGDGKKINGLVYKNRENGQDIRLELEGVFVQIGLLPNTDWLKGTVGLSKHGEIEVDRRGQTSAQGVFAAGDCTTVPYKQIIIAMGEGANAALSAFDYLIRSSP